MSIEVLSLIVAALSTAVYFLVKHPSVNDVARVVAGVAWAFVGVLALLQ